MVPRNSVCACTESAGTGTGAVCVERGGLTWPKKGLNHKEGGTHIQLGKIKRGTAVLSEEVSISLKHQEKRKKGRASN